MKVTNSRLRTFFDCPYKHHLKYTEGWRSTEVARPLYIGTAVHVGLEAWWLQSGSITAAITAIDRAEQGKDEPMDPYDMAMVRALIHSYDRRWRGVQDQYEVIAAEEYFEFGITDPETGMRSPALAAGKLDVTVRHVDGGVYVVEHKTTSDDISDPGCAYLTRLQGDSQLSHYSLGALSKGYELHGMVYDVLRKPQLKPKKESNPETRYKKDGTLKANMREHDETPGEFELRLRDKIDSEPESWLVRKPVFLTDADIVRYSNHLWDAMELVEFSMKGPRPKNDQACERIARGRCEFYDHCHHGVALADHPTKWEQVDDVHPELQEKDSE